jgi:hypothetical protein
MTSAERLDVGRQAGDPGVLLYEYILRMASIRDADITDESIADYFGWNIHKAKRIRLNLQRIGYLHTEVYKLNKHYNGKTHYVGKEIVDEILNKDASND